MGISSSPRVVLRHSLHAVPEALGFADLDNGVDGTVVLGLPAAHADNLQFPADHVERMRKEQRGTAGESTTAEFAEYQLWTLDRTVGREDVCSDCIIGVSWQQESQVGQRWTYVTRKCRNSGRRRVQRRLLLPSIRD